MCILGTFDIFEWQRIVIFKNNVNNAFDTRIHTLTKAILIELHGRNANTFITFVLIYFDGVPAVRIISAALWRFLGLRRFFLALDGFHFRSTMGSHYLDTSSPEFRKLRAKSDGIGTGS